MERQRETWPSLALYHLFKWSIVSPMLHSYFRGRIYGAERVPQRGPLVVVSNHGSYFDPPLLSNCVRRPVAYMAKAELFEIPVFNRLIRLYGAYPVKRGSSDRRAMEAALKALQGGWAVGVFLEGSRTTNGRITDPKLGAALIAAKAKAPLLPVCLWGTEQILDQSKWPRPVPITVRIGELVPAPKTSDRPTLNAVTQTCCDRINALHDLGR
ncbi:1-acyl-sn-glycerol-3-phosphate acyltransferase [Candidatus Synechococcus calcipolaris G9]|uniref:1-acyl-sn-glycerol-3-phosphate acyltransferase n=1 Tax=Candidatus Synechococcus calcipolaris G9 TaxID=1497997 RepID=A0ABT6EYR1_9SYNE|nr:lysophospholipid acyltransferase family protein [Candidatus Synechococcus calcipolaris]MDG2990577.1 1-acyl-sn-glycerol-3-phosphate acyltransferase [Candidatus Synechococcus calcipolaris G9]